VAELADAKVSKTYLPTRDHAHYVIYCGVLYAWYAYWGRVWEKRGHNRGHRIPDRRNPMKTKTTPMILKVDDDTTISAYGTDDGTAVLAFTGADGELLRVEIPAGHSAAYHLASSRR